VCAFAKKKELGPVNKRMKVKKIIALQGYSKMPKLKIISDFLKSNL
jgi:hypothetical protein